MEIFSKQDQGERMKKHESTVARRTRSCRKRETPPGAQAEHRLKNDEYLFRVGGGEMDRVATASAPLAAANR
jgi:hypothetical protein